jgi:hypothetical protein
MNLRYAAADLYLSALHIRCLRERSVRDLSLGFLNVLEKRANGGERGEEREEGAHRRHEVDSHTLTTETTRATNTMDVVLPAHPMR